MMPSLSAMKSAAKMPAKPSKTNASGKAQGFTKAELLHWHEQMLYMRRFEEKAAALYQQKEIQGFLHLYIGQEAIVAGLKAIAHEGDDFITSYRCHALALACGLTGEQVMGELTGRVIGISKGKGGSMHMFEPEKGFWGGHGIVAAQVPLGAGLAFARKYQNDVMGEANQRVCFTMIGDGAMNAGQVFEAFNMAALWKLPVIFVIENNKYGMGTSVPRAAAGELYKRGEPFGIIGEKVDGMDFMAVAEAGERATAYCRAGKGPYILEFDTYRYRGHSMSDPGKYRTREEVEGVRESRDPISRLQRMLMTDHGVKEAELDATDEAIKTEVNRVAEVATTAPRPGDDEIWTDVYPG